MHCIPEISTISFVRSIFKARSWDNIGVSGRSLAPLLALSSSRVGFQASHYLSKNLSTLNTEDDEDEGGGGPSFKFLHSPLLPHIDYYKAKKQVPFEANR